MIFVVWHIIWILSFLANTSQYVQYDNCDPEILIVSCGVPPGSVLGPKLFILYINDICNVSKILTFVLYADDTNMFCCDSNINEIVRLTNDELRKL